MRLGPWQQTTVYVSLAIVGLSGLVWFALHDFIEEEPGEIQHWWLVLNGVSAFDPPRRPALNVPTAVYCQWFPAGIANRSRSYCQ